MTLETKIEAKPALELKQNEYVSDEDDIEAVPLLDYDKTKI